MAGSGKIGVNFGPIIKSKSWDLFKNHPRHWFINWLIEWSSSSNIFQTLPIPNWKSKGAEILRECSLFIPHYVSCVTRHMSRVTCPLSHVKICLKKIGQSGGAGLLWHISISGSLSEFTRTSAQSRGHWWSSSRSTTPLSARSGCYSSKSSLSLQ